MPQKNLRGFCAVSTEPMGNSGDSDFPPITALLNTLHYGDNWIAKA